MDSLVSYYSENDTIYALTAFEKEKVTGFVALSFLDESKATLQIEGVIVNPMKRGQGYGKKLTALAMKYAFELLFAEELLVNVYEENEPALRMFQSIGFDAVPAEEESFEEVLGEQWKVCSLNIRKGYKGKEKKPVEIAEDSVLDEIIEKNTFKYAFQPIVEASTGQIYGYEALMRADHGGPISPSVILKYAKEKNRLYDIEKATFFNVLSFVSKERANLEGRRVFVNSIPGYQLNEEDYDIFAERYAEILPNVTIEITEENDIIDRELASLMNRSKRDGFNIAIDDYGTGYSNTSSLLRCVPNCIKMDRLLISSIHEEPKKQHFVKSIIEFAHNNGILALAEGVETVQELKAVIEMGVDLIQGFYTARPSFEIIQEIDEEVRNEILNVNVKGQTQMTRRVFVVEQEKELPLMRLTLEKYTGIVLGNHDFYLVGNTNYVAAMSIKIKDDSDCRLTIRNVNMESILDLPCIEIGKNSHLTLVVEGDNRFRKVGICVPEGSSLDVIGDGSVSIRAQGVNSYGVGNGWDSGVGSIRWSANGSLSILVEADRGIGIGGGEYRSGSGIKITSGNISLEPASKESICVGCVTGDIPIEIQNCAINMTLRTDRGIGIGSLQGRQNISIASSKIDVNASGATIACIGTYHESGGSIRMEKTGFSAEANGQFLTMIGNGGGGLRIYFVDSGVRIIGEGHQVLGVGCQDGSASVDAFHSDVDITLRSKQYTVFGAAEENIKFKGGRRKENANA